MARVCCQTIRDSCQGGGCLQLTLTLAAFRLTSDQSDAVSTCRFFDTPKKRFHLAPPAQWSRRSSPQPRHEDDNAVSSLGPAQLVIFTKYYLRAVLWHTTGRLAGLVIFWTALKHCSPSLLGIPPGIWSGWDQRSCQKTTHSRQLGTWVQ